MEQEAILALYDQEQRIEIEYPDMRKEILPHVVRFVRPGPGMSQIRFSSVDEYNADQVIAEQIEYFRPHDGPFSWKLYSHDRPADLGERLAGHNFVGDESEPVMILDLHHSPAALLEPVTADVRRLTRPEQLDDVIQIMAQVWGGSFDWMRGRMGPHLEIPGYLSLYVAYAQGNPACAGWTYFYKNSHFAGIFGGSTLPAYRKQGLYTAVLATRVQEAIQRGYRFMVIEASSMSRPIVSRHGFTVLTYSQDFEWQRDQGA